MDKNSHKSILHSGVQDFQKLAQDPRFIALMAYLRRHISARGSVQLPPESIIRNEGRFQGWFECLEEAEWVLDPPKQESPDNQPKPAYQPRK